MMLEMQGVTKSYNGRAIFRDLNLQVPENAVMSVVGPSGIGKTTLIKIIAGLITADAGTMTLAGKAAPITTLAKRPEVGLIFQDFNLFPHYTVRDNITLALRKVQKQSRSQANAAAQQVLADLGIADKQNLYPYQLSGGQKQRVAIARALAMKPKVLVYDEPTSGLDVQATQHVADVVQRLRGHDVTQVIITHDTPFAEQVSTHVFDFATDVARDSEQK